MSLLQDIQDSATGSNTPLSDLLRKCLVLAARLKSNNLKNWVEKELNGYANNDNLPKYRILHVNSYGYFCGPFQSGWRNAPIPPSCIPENLRKLATTHYFIGPVSALEDLVRGQTSGNLQSPWDPDMTALVGEQIYEGMNCLSAWRMIPRNSIVGVLDTIRTRILNFVLEIESQYPDAGEATSGKEPVPQERVNQVFNTLIMGNVGNLATGSRDSQQSSVVNVNVLEGDFESLRSYLNELGIAPEDIEDLNQALSKDKSEVDEKKGIGNNVSKWVGKIIGKASAGALTVATSVASGLITKALSKYLGLQS